MNTTNKFYGQLTLYKKREINDEIGALAKFAHLLREEGRTTNQVVIFFQGRCGDLSKKGS